MRPVHLVRAWLRFVIVAFAAGAVLAADAGEVVHPANSGTAGQSSDRFTLTRDLDPPAKTRYDMTESETEPLQAGEMVAPPPMTAREQIDLADVLYPSSLARACELAGADSGRDYGGMSDSRIGHGGSRSRMSSNLGYRMVMKGNGGMDLVRDINFD